ncbi:MAG TPA: hypothetical protein VEA63_07165 [Opitutus sp.]|nr:hypothetical protein [Opitutus sp.]
MSRIEKSSHSWPSERSIEAAPETEWGALIPDDQWEVFMSGVNAMEESGVPFLLAGALALATYTGHWRNTKDVDVIVRECDRERAVAALRGVGFEDYFEQQAYDRSWIFRGFKDGVLFDVIWALPNHRVGVDEAWFAHATPVCLRGRKLRTAPAEEIVRVKLYVMQRERCDWVDVLNVMAAWVERIDWAHLVERMGRDLPLLQGALAIFNWMCPGRAQALPAWLREQFALPRIEADDQAAMEERRVRLFDSRPWFALHQPVDRPLER